MTALSDEVAALPPDAQRERIAKVVANRAALDVLATKARAFSRGTTALTLAQLTSACRELAEMQARMWFNERFGDDP